VFERNARRVILLLSLASAADDAVPLLSQLLFDQLARGPPVVAWEKLHCQPSGLGGSVRARPFTRGG
jgi:hypothetical protein